MTCHNVTVRVFYLPADETINVTPSIRGLISGGWGRGWRGGGVRPTRQLDHILVGNWQSSILLSVPGGPSDQGGVDWLGHIWCNYQNNTKLCTTNPTPLTQSQSKHCWNKMCQINSLFIALSQFLFACWTLATHVGTQAGQWRAWLTNHFLVAGRRMRTRPGEWSNPPVWTTCWTGSRTTRSSGSPSWPSWPLSRWWSPWSLPTSFRKWRRSRRWGEWYSVVVVVNVGGPVVLCD